MQRRHFIAASAVVVGLGLVFYAVFSRQSEEEQIQEVLDRLELSVGVSSEPENPVFRLTRLNKEFEELFDDRVRVFIPELTSLRSGRKDLAGLAARAPTWFSTLEIDFTDVKIQAGKINARVFTSAQLVASRAGRGLERDVRDVEFGFTKSDGSWKIDSVNVTPREEQAEEE
jgi:hypothetical protein